MKNGVFLHQAQARCATILKVGARRKGHRRERVRRKQTSNRKAGGVNQSDRETQQAEDETTKRKRNMRMDKKTVTKEKKRE